MKDQVTALLQRVVGWCVEDFNLLESGDLPSVQVLFPLCFLSFFSSFFAASLFDVFHGRLSVAIFESLTRRHRSRA